MQWKGRTEEAHLLRAGAARDAIVSYLGSETVQPACLDLNCVQLSIEAPADVLFEGCSPGLCYHLYSMLCERCAADIDFTRPGPCLGSSSSFWG